MKKTAKAKPSKTERSKTVANEKRGYLSQTDVPGISLENALRIPRAISENYADGPVTPLQLAATGQDKIRSR